MLAIKETSTRATGALKLKNTKAANGEKIDALAKEFEAQFISQMMSAMFETVDAKQALGGSESEEMYRSLLVDEYGKIISRTGGIGVADQVKRIMIHQQEVE